MLLGDYSLHKELSLGRIPRLRPAQAVTTKLRFEEPLRLDSPNQYCFFLFRPNQLGSGRTQIMPDILISLVASGGERGVARYTFKHINRNGDLDLPLFISSLSFRFSPHRYYRGREWFG